MTTTTTSKVWGSSPQILDGTPSINGKIIFVVPRLQQNISLWQIESFEELL